MSDCRHKWCTQGDHGGEPTLHHGVYGVARSGGSEVEVTVYLDTRPDDAALSYTFDMDWNVFAGDLEKEMRDIRSVTEQVESIIRAAHTECAPLVPRSTFYPWAPSPSSETKPLRRPRTLEDDLRGLDG